MKTIRRIDAKSLAKIAGMLYAIFGFVAGIFVLIMTIINQTGGSAAPSALFSYASPIILPILYGLLGLLFGFLTGVFYNFIAKRVGGLRIEIID